MNAKNHWYTYQHDRLRAEEIVNSGYPAPDLIQLQLSPFNQHCDILRWANTHGSIMSCAAWSKLSSGRSDLAIGCSQLSFL